MRLDKYLKVSRLIKRRTVANEACDNGRISVNGRVVKASYDVKVGDKLEITMGPRTIAVEVLVVADNVRKDDAGAICRCFNWRESVRTMLTEETVNAFMCIETVEGEKDDIIEVALDELKLLIEKELGGKVEKHILSKANTEVVICE